MLVPQIFQSGLMERHHLDTAEDLFAWLSRVNATLGRRNDEAWAEFSRGYKGMGEKVGGKTIHPRSHLPRTPTMQQSSRSERARLRVRTLSLHDDTSNTRKAHAWANASCPESEKMFGRVGSA